MTLKYKLEVIHTHDRCISEIYRPGAIFLPLTMDLSSFASSQQSLHERNSIA